MTKKREDLKILLLQFRLTPEMRQQELECYLKFGKLSPEQITGRFFIEEDIDIDNLKEYDAVIIGGAGDLGVNEFKEKMPEKYEQLKEIAKYCRENKIPVLSVCLQVWAPIWGGEVTTDKSRQEVGTYTIKLTKEAANDPLLKDMPESFKAQLGHKDYVSKLPEGAVLLAYSDICPSQIYRIGDLEYVFQIHIDLDKEKLIERLNFYAKFGYVPEDPEEFKKLIAGIEETPESVQLIEKWVDRIVLKN